MSGPFARRMWPLALMEFSDRVPIKNTCSRSALIYAGLPDPGLDRFAITSSSPSQSCGIGGHFRLLARRSPWLGRLLHAPSRPRQCGRFYWRARPRPLWPAFAPEPRAPIRRLLSRVCGHAEERVGPRRPGAAKVVTSESGVQGADEKLLPSFLASQQSSNAFCDGLKHLVNALRKM